MTKRYLRFVLVWFFVPLTLYTDAVAQQNDKASIDVWGVFQPRLSYGSSDDTTATAERLGFGIRRARLRVEAALQNRIGVRYDADFASGTFQSVDLFAFYHASPTLTFRLGVMPSAQPRAHIFTPIPLIDGFDRAAIAEQWAASTLGGGGRDFGFDVQYQTPNWTLVGFLHNGDGGFARNRGNFSQTISSGSATAGVDMNALAVSVYAAHRPPDLEGLEVGGYISSNPNKNPNTATENAGGREYFSYSAHLYYGAEPGSRPIRGKFDLIGLNFRGEADQQQVGISIFSAARLAPSMEAFGRYERLKRDADLAAENFWSAGITYSLSQATGGPFHTQRLTLGYSLFDAAADRREHLLVLQWNLVI